MTERDGGGVRPAVHFEEAGAVARIVLARPELKNPIDRDFVVQLAKAVQEISSRRDIRAVAILADGPAFTVGGDRTQFAGNVDAAVEHLAGLVDRYQRTLIDLGNLMVPVLCAVQGAVAGAGLGLLWVSDMVIAGADLRLVSAFDRLGISGDGGSTWALPRLVGLRRACQILMQGRVLDADAALEWGLVDQVVPPDALRAEAEEQAKRLAEGPTLAFGHMRRLLRQSSASSWAEQLASEQAAMIDCLHTEDCREGVHSLIERRVPEFRGR